jgi:hypothetical protein
LPAHRGGVRGSGRAGPRVRRPPKPRPPGSPIRPTA